MSDQTEDMKIKHSYQTGGVDLTVLSKISNPYVALATDNI